MCAILGVIASLVFWVAAILGVKSLRDIRKSLRDTARSGARNRRDGG